jgi:hypothetical protein
MGNKMAQEAKPWEEFQPTQPTAGQGVVIPKAPEKPEAPPSGFRPGAQGDLEFVPGGPSDPAVIAREAAARRGGEGKSATELELEAKRAGESKRKTTINAILGNVRNFYQADIAGQPIERLGGLLETEVFAGLPKNERFNAASEAMLPLIRPLIAQSAKEGDSDKEMSVFMAYIPRASDSDITIETKLNMLETLIGGMVDGKAPSQMQNEAIAKSGGSDRLQEAFDRGASEDELLALSKELFITPDIAQLKDAIEYRDKGGKGARITPPPIVETGRPPAVNLTPMLESFYAGVGDVAQGVGDIVGLVGNPANAAVNALLGTDLSTNLGETFREATGAPTGDPTASAITRGAISALVPTAGASTLLPRVAPGAARDVLTALAAQPLQQVAGGAGAGFGAEVARQQGGGPIAQVAAGLAGGVGGAGLAGATRSLTAPRAAAPRGVAEAEAAGIPVMTSDVIPAETFAARTAQQVSERIPFVGTGGMRTAQQTAREDAVTQLIRDSGAEDVIPKQIADELRIKREADLTKYTTMKDEALAAANGAGVVPVPRLLEAIDNQIAILSRKRTGPADEAILKLQEIRAKALEPRNLEAIEGLRRDELGPAFQDATLSVGASDRVKSAVKALYDPLRQDMGDFIGENAGQAAKNRWGVANARLSEGMDELNRNALKAALREAETTPEKVDTLLFSTKPSDVAALYRNLTPTGKTLARAAIIRRAAEQSTARTADGTLDLEKINPDKFAMEIGRLGKSIGITFPSEELTRVKGLVDAIRLTQRAGQANILTQSGQQTWYQALLPGLVGGGAGFAGGAGLAGGSIAGGVTGLVAVPLTMGAIARVFESKTVRDLALKMGRVKEPEKAATAKRLISAINAASGQETESQ